MATAAPKRKRGESRESYRNRISKSRLYSPAEVNIFVMDFYSLPYDDYYTDPVPTPDPTPTYSTPTDSYNPPSYDTGQSYDSGFSSGSDTGSCF